MPVNPPPEIAFLASPLGGAITIAISVGVFVVTLLWARNPAHNDRPTAVLAAGATSLLVGLFSLVASWAGWWQGSFFQIPLPVMLSIYLPFSIAGYTLWLGIYRWLRTHVRHPFAIYTAMVLLFIPIVLLVDPIQMSRGQFEMGNGYTVWIDTLAGQVVMLSPVAFYELFSRWVLRPKPSSA